MNTTAKTLSLIAVATVAALAFASTLQQPEVVKLERVVITGKRMNVEQVAQLPRVVIEGRSLRATQLAQAEACKTAVC